MLLINNYGMTLYDCRSSDLSHNSLAGHVATELLDNITALTVLDLRVNPRLASLPAWQQMDNMSIILVDKGSTCCILELELTGD
jgi:hypothetical protein